MFSPTRLLSYPRLMKRALMLLLVLVVAGLAVAKLLVYELPRVGGNDMAPALQPGDLLLANKLARTPGRGEIVLLEDPSQPRRLLLRRVVGLPGERIAVRDETPVVEGEAARRTVASELALRDLVDGREREVPMRLVEEQVRGARYRVLKDPSRRSIDAREVRLDARSYYVLADNRNHGTDSRTFGPVPAEKIRASVTYRLSAGPGSVKGQSAREGWQRLSE